MAKSSPRRRLTKLMKKHAELSGIVDKYAAQGAFSTGDGNPVIVTIPEYKDTGRPILLFPEGWQRGWMQVGGHHVGVPMDAESWAFFRDLYYKRMHVDPFGRLPMVQERGQTLADQVPGEIKRAAYLDLHSGKGLYSAEFGRPYAPWGLSTVGIPLLHPSDQVEHGVIENSVFIG